MRSRLAAPVATILLLAGSAPLIAGEPSFNVPATVRARQSVVLLDRAARALYDLSPSAGRISALWLFPTADADTVFAEYTLTGGRGASATDHLVVLTLRGDRIVAMRDLTEAVAEPTHEEAAVHSHTEESDR